MTDLVCFKVSEGFADRVLIGLKKDFYKAENLFAVGEPVFVVEGGSALFLCPVMYPIRAVRHVVEPLVIKGFKSSFAKKGIVLERVRPNKKLEALYDEVQGSKEQVQD